MTEIEPDDARAGSNTKKRPVFRILIASLVLVAVAWFVISQFF